MVCGRSTAPPFSTEKIFSERFSSISNTCLLHSALHKYHLSQSDEEVDRVTVSLLRIMFIQSGTKIWISVDLCINWLMAI